MSKISKKSRKGDGDLGFLKATVSLCNWIYPTLGMMTPIPSAMGPIPEMQSVFETHINNWLFKSQPFC